MDSDTYDEIIRDQVVDQNRKIEKLSDSVAEVRVDVGRLSSVPNKINTLIGIFAALIIAVAGTVWVAGNQLGRLEGQLEYIVTESIAEGEQ